ncbi:MAG: hypothetical protein WHV44_08075 [Anaerolineales bacterium]
MLSLALLIAAVIAANDVYGRALLNLSAPGHAPTFIPRTLTGMALTTALAAALSLILPLEATALGLLVLPALALALWQARGFTIPRLSSMPAPVWALLALFLLAVLHNAALPVSNFDIGLYHAQSIQWLEKFPAVPGLANLHERLGFNSNWFGANAWSGLGFLHLADFRPASAALFLALLGSMLAQ